MILAGDVGGTKTALALFEDELRCVREEVYASQEYPSLAEVLDEFLRDRAPAALVGACFAAAGPVEGSAIETTNLPWRIEARRLSECLGGIPVWLLNDLQATALGILTLPDSSFAVLQPGRPADRGSTIAVLAPGTGLGEAVLIADRDGYRALPSEGGHADFAPGTDAEVEFWRILRARHGGHVSYERVLSGDGIAELYDYARARVGEPEPAWLADQMLSGDRNAAISKAALERTDTACIEALDLFAAVLGAEAGNLALRALAVGGVVIGGGIAPHIVPVLKAEGLVERFNAKGRFAEWTREISLRVALEPRAALLGAGYHAQAHGGRRDAPGGR
jgi:glucokinase